MNNSNINPYFRKAARDVARISMLSSRELDIQGHTQALVFYKYLSDTWKQTNSELFSNRDDTFIKIPEGFDFISLYEVRQQEKIGERIKEAYKAITEANNDTLSGIFSNLNFNTLFEADKKHIWRNYYASMLEVLNEPYLDMKPSRVSKKIVFKFLSLLHDKTIVSSKHSSENSTPRFLSELLAKLAKPSLGDSICDPACGIGETLIECANLLENNCKIYGMDINKPTCSSAKINLFLNDLNPNQIKQCNSITQPAFINGDELIKFDIVVCDPPYSQERWWPNPEKEDKFKRYWRGIPHRSDWAYICHMIESTKPKEGRACVLVPQGALFRGLGEARIRKSIIDQNLLDTVISLPSNLLKTTSIPMSVLLFDRSRESGGENSNLDSVLFIDATDTSNYSRDRLQNTLAEHNISKIVATAQNKVAEISFSSNVSVKKIEDNSYDLSVPLYVESVPENNEIDLDATAKKIKGLEIKLNETVQIINALLKS